MSQTYIVRNGAWLQPGTRAHPERFVTLPKLELVTLKERNLPDLGKIASEESGQRVARRLTDRGGYNQPRGRQISAFWLKEPVFRQKKRHILLESATLKEIEEFDLVFSLVLACRY